MPVGDDEVQEPVVVVVEEGRAPLHVGNAAGGRLRAVGNVGEVVAVVVVEGVVLLGEVRHVDAQPADVVVVAQGHPHASLLPAVLAHRHPHWEGDLLEGAVLLVLVEEVRAGVVGHVEVRPAVAVEVEPGHAQAEVLARVADASLLSDLGEVPVPVVPEQEVRFAGEASRAALHVDAAILASLALAELRELVEVEVHVAADEEVEVPVPIVVGKATTRRPASARNARLLRDVGEGAVVVVAIQRIAAEAGDVDVLPAVSVHVRRAHAHRPARVGEPGPVGHVLEPPVAQVPIKGAARGLRVLGRLHRGGIGQVDVEEPVALMDSTMNFFSGASWCSKAIPASRVMSRKSGRAGPPGVSWTMAEAARATVMTAHLKAASRPSRTP